MDSLLLLPVTMALEATGLIVYIFIVTLNIGFGLRLHENKVISAIAVFMLFISNLVQALLVEDNPFLLRVFDGVLAGVWLLVIISLIKEYYQTKKS